MTSDRQNISHQKVSETRHISLRLVLIVPFVLQILAAVGLVGYLSYRNGQAAVENLANQLTAQAAKRVHDHLKVSLQIHQQSVAINHQAVREAGLDINNHEQMQEYLWQQINLSLSLSNTNFTSDKGEETAYQRILSKEFLAQAEKLSGEKLKLGLLFFGKTRNPEITARKFYLIDNQGKEKKFVYQSSLDVRTSDWYVAAKAAKKQTWSPVIVYRSPTTLGIKAIFPLYDDAGNLQGVFSSGTILDGIGTFLNKLNFSPSGKAFIIEHSGDLVATSTLETPYLKNDKDKLTRLPAIQSQDTQTKAIATQLRQQYADLHKIPDNLNIQVYSEGKTLFAHIFSYHDEYGLDWLVAVIIPDSDFMTEIQANRNSTILLCLLTLVIATGLGIMTSNWIAVPIQELSQASKAIANGNLSQIVKVKGITELEALADTFNDMGQQLQRSFDNLENRVESRTAELLIANRKLEALVNLDGLTHIANRRCFNEYLSLEWQRHQREQNPLSLIMIDIDYFKRYNDTYGHQGGDDCLIQVAQAIVQVPLRPTDLVARYGGEEFVAILSNTDTEGALKVAESIQKAIFDLAIPHETRVDNYVTLSMGISSLIPNLELNLEMLIAQADKALYAAKDQGRNRAIAYDIAIRNHL